MFWRCSDKKNVVVDYHHIVIFSPHGPLVGLPQHLHQLPSHQEDDKRSLDSPATPRSRPSPLHCSQTILEVLSLNNPKNCPGNLDNGLLESPHDHPSQNGCQWLQACQGCGCVTRGQEWSRGAASQEVQELSPLVLAAPCQGCSTGWWECRQISTRSQEWARLWGSQACIYNAGQETPAETN